MKRKIITIKNGIISVPQSGEVKMTVSEIALLFDVYVREIYKHAKAVMKSEVIKVDVSCPVIVIGNTVLPDIYGLEMIIAFAFQIQSYKAEVFRNWLIKQAVKQSPVSIWWGNEQKICLN